MAYEPRWAIGAQDAASPTYAAERHRLLRSRLEARYGTAVAATVRIIYGGSVNRDNAIPLITQPEIDGLFVGRAAWSAEGFAEIVRIVAACQSTGEEP